MANPIKGEAALQAGDQVFTLRLSINAIVELEDHFKVGINEIAAKLSDTAKMRIADWRVVMWAALCERHPGTTLKDAGEVLTQAGLAPSIAALGKAMQLAFPEASEGANRPS